MPLLALLAATMAGGGRFSPDGGRAPREPYTPTTEDLDRRAAKIARRKERKLRTAHSRGLRGGGFPQ